MARRLQEWVKEDGKQSLGCQANCQCRHIEIPENCKKRGKTSHKLKMLPQISIITFTMYLHIVLRNISYIIFFKKSRKHTTISLIWILHIADDLGLFDTHSQTYSYHIFLSCSICLRYIKRWHYLEHFYLVGRPNF